MRKYLYFSGVRGVINKGILTLDNAQLKVTIIQPVKKPPTDTTRLFVKGLSDKTTLDGLGCYMEVVSGSEVLSIEFGKEECALVTFKENYGKFVCFLRSKCMFGLFLLICIL